MRNSGSIVPLSVGSVISRAALCLLAGVCDATTPGANRLTGVEVHLAANDVEVRNASPRPLSECRLSFDHRLRSGVFELAVGQVLRVSLEDFHVDPPGPVPPEVQFTHVFLECREGRSRFATG